MRGEGGVCSCADANECAEVGAKNVGPAGAIQQAKLANVLSWARSVVVRRRAAS